MVRVHKSEVGIFFFICLFVCLVGTSLAFGTTDLYMSKSGAGSRNGLTSCANAFSWNYFNTSGNWSNSPSGSQIGPGVTVHHCAETDVDSTPGDTALTFQCGTANGKSSNPITLTFDQGATNFYNSTYWSTTLGAIGSSGACSYVIVNGDNNLTIANQDSGGTPHNGSGLAYEQASQGIAFYGGCANCTIENATIANIYVNNGSVSGATDANGLYSYCIAVSAPATNTVITENTVSTCSVGILVSADPNSDASNVVVSNNTVSDMHWGINVGAGDSGSTINNLKVHDNQITNWTNWSYPTSAYHLDGIIIYNAGSGATTMTAQVYNNYIYGSMATVSATGFIFCSINAQCTVFNNVLNSTTYTDYGIIWQYTGKAGFKAYNNTISGIGSSYCFMLNSVGTATSVSAGATFEGNICTGTYSGLSDYQTLTSDVAISNHNLWRNGGGAPPYAITNFCCNGTSLSYTTWQGYGYDANSSTSNPNLNGTFTLQAGSSAIGLGANLTSLGITALNTGAPQTFGAGGSCGSGCIPRPPTGAWDAGAYPFGSAAAPPAPTSLTATVH